MGPYHNSEMDAVATFTHRNHRPRAYRVGHLWRRVLSLRFSAFLGSTLCLPNGAFCPTILWIARRLCEDAMRTKGVIERRSMVMVQGACQAAMVIASQDSCDGYAQLISQQTSNRHAQDGWHRTQLPWPTLRRSFINCPASFASSQGELWHLHATCATIATGRTLLPDSFRSAWEALQRASLHGRVAFYAFAHFEFTGVAFAIQSAFVLVLDVYHASCMLHAPYGLCYLHYSCPSIDN